MPDAGWEQTGIKIWLEGSFPFVFDDGQGVQGVFFATLTPYCGEIGHDVEVHVPILVQNVELSGGSASVVAESEQGLTALGSLIVSGVLFDLDHKTKDGRQLPGIWVDLGANFPEHERTLVAFFGPVRHLRRDLH
ncbi:MAG: hypothetical protein WC480_01160 [Patescibacteria group bacterium]